MPWKTWYLYIKTVEFQFSCGSYLKRLEREVLKSENVTNLGWGKNEWGIYTENNCYCNNFVLVLGRIKTYFYFLIGRCVILLVSHLVEE